MEFSSENYYIILEDFFYPSENRILLEIKSAEIEDITAQINLNEFVGKGVAIYLSTFIAHVSDDEVDDYDLVLKKERSKYAFQLNEVLKIYPLIEGKFTPGIYKRDEETQFCKLDDVEAFSKEYSGSGAMGLSYEEFKLVCASDKIDIVLVKNGEEYISETVMRRPFTYFDLFCPICSKQIMKRRDFEDGSMRCFMQKMKCEHFIGVIEKVDGKYIRLYLDDLEADYKLENEELYLNTNEGWKKPVIYIPPYDPVNSYWGKSGGDDQIDVFLFFESEKIIPKKETAEDSLLEHYLEEFIS